VAVTPLAGCLSSNPDRALNAYAACRRAVREQIEGPANFPNYYGGADRIDIEQGRDETRFEIKTTVTADGMTRDFRCLAVRGDGEFSVDDLELGEARPAGD